MTILSHGAVTIFDGMEPNSTSYVYTSGGGSAATSGWFDARAEHVCVQLCAATLTASHLKYRIEGRSNTYTRAASIATGDITATMFIDKVIDVSAVGYFKEIRVGCKVTATTNATPNAFHAGLILVEER